MKKFLPWLILAVLVGGAFLALQVTGKTRDFLVFVGLKARPADDKVYWCPMHPFYKVKRYGICPYCNMELEPYTAGPGTKEAEATLVLTAQQIQQAGVRTEKVRRRELVHEIETTGMIELNHERYWHIEFRFEGWIEELYIHNLGERIETGGAVAKVYSPVLFTSQKEYLIALSSNDQPLLESSRKRLELMGVDDREIKALEERKEPSARLTLRSKVAGTVMHVNVKAGMKVPEDGHIADVADLRELWAFADLYDRELGNVTVGQEVHVEAAGRTHEGRIDLIEPLVKAETQTSRVRIRVKNDPPVLRPGQFARALILTRLPDTLAVSEYAAIPTGRRDLVILALGGGRFTAREVKLGRRWLTGTEIAEDRGLGFFTGHNRYHEVKSGLREGEEVVTSGVFLLHAETQIRNLIDKMAPEMPESITRSRWSGKRIASGDFADQSEEAAYRQNPEKSWEKREPLVRQQVAALLERYFLMNGALDKKNEPLAGEYAVSMGAIPIRDALSDALDPDVRAAITALADAAAANETNRNKHFGMVSAALERYIAEFGNPLDRPLHQFYCGMAKNAVGSPSERWFQLDGELRNPFGMPGCGSHEKEIPPTARPSILDAYFSLHEAHVSNGDIPAAVRALQQSADDSPLAAEMKKAAGPTQKDFGALTLVLEKHLAKSGPPAGRTIHQFYCGMAKDAVGSPSERWFQKDQQLRNPYGMPKCGRYERSWP